MSCLWLAKLDMLHIVDKIDMHNKINKIDDALNKAISDLQNLQQVAPPQISPRPKRSLPNRYARVSTQEKRQTAYEVQVLQTKIVVVRQLQLHFGWYIQFLS